MTELLSGVIIGERNLSEWDLCQDNYNKKYTYKLYSVYRGTDFECYQKMRKIARANGFIKIYKTWNEVFQGYLSTFYLYLRKVADDKRCIYYNRRGLEGYRYLDRHIFIIKEHDPQRL